MPQVRDTAAFLEYLHQRGVHHHGTHIASQHLHPTQNEINLGLVFKLLVKGLNTGKHPLLVAGDKHILDGHNRWYAGVILEQPVWVIEIDYDIHSLIRLANAWPGTTHEAIDHVGNVEKGIGNAAVPNIS